MALNASSQKWHMPLLLILHWPKQVTWSSMASMGKEYNLLQGWAGREGFGKERTTNIFTIMLSVAVYFWTQWLYKKNFSVFEEYLKLEVGEGRKMYRYALKRLDNENLLVISLLPFWGSWQTQDLVHDSCLIGVCWNNGQNLLTIGRKQFFSLSLVPFPA